MSFNIASVPDEVKEFDGRTSSKICIIAFRPGTIIKRASQGDQPILRMRGISIIQIFRPMKIELIENDFNAVLFSKLAIKEGNIVANTPTVRIMHNK
ncbi:MAG: hypothetical protein HC799_19505 [Limnothrix sp. RL_2_0]|nr:hypothetical protein [Limnothrix sp. RL_2_0]